jgi:isochorismate hydrolase
MSDWRLTPQNAALVVIDVQEKLMNVMPQRIETLSAIQKLAGAARTLGLPTLVTAQYIKGLGPVCDEITKATCDIAPLEKMTFSCCGSEEFLHAVKDLRRQRIILCGIEAHVCVQQTAIDLMKDYVVYIAADAVCSRHETDYVVAIERMRDCGAIITTIESAIFEILRESGTEQFKQILPLLK